MTDQEKYLESLIDTPEKARAAKQYLDGVDPSSLSPEDRQGYLSAQRALQRWVNPAPTSPDRSIYLKPRTPGDVISKQVSRPPVASSKPEDFKTPN